MNATCLRCDWRGDTAAASCPECGAPLYRPAPRDPVPRGAAQPPDTMPMERAPWARDAPERARPVPSSPRRILLIAGAFFAMIGFLFWRGGGNPDAGRVAGSRPTPPETGGRLIYAVPTGDSAARLWRWDLRTDRVTRGPLIPSPLALVNVRSSAHGWLGITSDAGDGIREASVLDSLDAGAVPESIGRGDIVTWTDRGTTVVLVERGPLLDRCHRLVHVTAVSIDSPREHVLRDTICGDVASVGRTSLGYFLTILRDHGADVVGVGYRDAGTLLRGHGMIDVSPAGHMLVTPASEFLPQGPPSNGSDPPTIRVSGAAFAFRLFGGRPVDLQAGAVPLRIERVLSYSDGSVRALVIGRRGRGAVALWEIALGIAGLDLEPPRSVIDVDGFTDAAYANDGTAFILTGGRLWHLRDDRLTAVELPGGAPAPAGPIAWILQEPTT